MAAPATVEELVELIRKSGVADAKRLEAALQGAQGAGSPPSDPAALTAKLVEAGVLTRFQAEQFLLGKWRRFTIGNFKVLERLGSGGMGNVFLCEHKAMRQRVAVKVLATVMAENPESVKRFQREARAAFGLVHPNVVRAHDLGMDDKLHFLVMDYVDGTCLHDLLKKYGRMDVLRAAHYVAQAAQGLQYAHEAGLIHRDIKPANLILDRGGTVKILDMGIARFAEAETEVLTRGPLGTADYLAPEQARDSHNVDARADIYSLGATFYTMLTGKLPFAEAKTVAQKLISVQMRDPTPIRTIRPDVPEGISHVIAKMMAKDPAQRYQTLKDVVRDLEPWTSQPIPPPPENEMPSLSPALLPASPTTLPPARSGIPSEKKTQASPPPPSSRPKLLAGAAVAAAVAIGIWIWWTFLRTAQ